MWTGPWGSVFPGLVFSTWFHWSEEDPVSKPAGLFMSSVTVTAVSDQSRVSPVISHFSWVSKIIISIKNVLKKKTLSARGARGALGALGLSRSRMIKTFKFWRVIKCHNDTKHDIFHLFAELRDRSHKTSLWKNENSPRNRSQQHLWLNYSMKASLLPFTQWLVPEIWNEVQCMSCSSPPHEAVTLETL